MRNKFRIEVRFTGITVAAAREVLEDMNLYHEVSANGFWQVIPDEFADMAIVDGKVVRRDYYTGSASVSSLTVTEYSGRLVSPLISKGEVRDLVPVMNRLYGAGAVVVSAECVKIHFLGKYSSSKSFAILRKLAKDNKLLYTVLFFPRLMAPLCLPARDYEEDEALSTAIFHAYTGIIDGICQCNDGIAVMSGVVGDLLLPHTQPECETGKIRTRFDRDSSPDSETDD